MHWSFEDPVRFEGTDEEKLAKFRQVRDLIGQKIIAWVTEKSRA
jgi:arsenate reductase